ncbi:hypothetical protein GGX14DRAFT_30251, partial [Mycena pura]
TFSVNLSGINHVCIHCDFSLYDDPALYGIWLCQANHIFSSLNITSEFEDYVFVANIHYEIKVSSGRDTLPPGFLFLCPTTDLQMEDCTRRQHPDCPAYWSLDPAGVQRLSPEAAKELGFPDIELKVTVRGEYWDGSVFSDIRKFHQAKGFDPDSCDVARKLGYSRYQVSPDFQVPFAHSEWLQFEIRI